MILVALLGVGFVCLAQSTFTQATFKEMSDEYKKDSKPFLLTVCLRILNMATQKESFYIKESVITSDAQNILTTLQAIDRMENSLGNDVLEPVIFQLCDLAIVSGRHKTTPIGNDGSETPSEVACTYTFKKRKVKWMFGASQQTSLAQ